MESPLQIAVSIPKGRSGVHPLKSEKKAAREESCIRYSAAYYAEAISGDGVFFTSCACYKIAIIGQEQSRYCGEQEGSCILLWRIVITNLE